MNYYFVKETTLDFDAAVEKVTGLLKEQGFGIITQIDVKETFKQKINEDFRKYKILGACNPSFAFKAINSEPLIGLLLPCNVVVQEKTGGMVEVSAINPKVNLELVKNEAVNDLACTVTEILEKVIRQI
ncbi:MAG: DUF302 domain-containing protein [Lentimicrobium sp.]|jgi:uncharacterized protein (DUF302 family)|nr:DUF302 domain-containing protein [Lentimicrobium sp.]